MQLASFILSAALALLCAGYSSARRVHIDGRQLIVDGKPTIVRGICYSPTPVNESVYFAPYGDYFGPDHSFIWLRDLSLMKEMGANVIRTYGWQPSIDHSAFLDAAADNGLSVMATYYMGESSETPVTTEDDRTKVIQGFKKIVAKYAGHPSLLFWSFGNELNGVWNGYLTDLGKDPGQEQCNWDERYDDLGGCWIHKRMTPFPPEHPCYAASYCVYSRLFKLINDAAEAAKEVADVLVVSAFADVDNLYEKIGRAGDLAPTLDAWTAQVYRGSSFGNFFEAMGNNTDKPILLTEYGVDAYHDECGAGTTTPCYNTFEDTLDHPNPGNGSGSYEDGEAQAVYAMNLTAEIIRAASNHPKCAKADHNSLNGDCSCIGGFLMSWTDEFWKGAKSQAKCEPTYGDPSFSAKTCDDKAHVTCGNWNAAYHDLCGYWLEAAPDHYVNEEWFGITSPTTCASSIDSLRPRETYWRMRKLWTGKDHDPDLFSSCDDLVAGHCVAIGDGGKGSSMLADWIGGRVKTSKEPLECSGRGKCTTDLSECGTGASDIIATPCCSCDFGFAGVGCSELDARVYLALAVGAALGGLVLVMLLNSLFSAVRRRVVGSELKERLLS